MLQEACDINFKDPFQYNATLYRKTQKFYETSVSPWKNKFDNYVSCNKQFSIKKKKYKSIQRQRENPEIAHKKSLQLSNREPIIKSVPKYREDLIQQKLNRLFNKQQMVLKLLRKKSLRQEKNSQRKAIVIKKQVSSQQSIKTSYSRARVKSEISSNKNITAQSINHKQYRYFNFVSNKRRKQSKRLNKLTQSDIKLDPVLNTNRK